MLEGSADVTVGPRQGAEPTWLVGPLQLTRSHQRVTFLPGTLIYAASDSFHGKGDCLFRLMSTSNVTVVGYGATLRMRRKDYAKTGSGKSNGRYSVSEFRHGLDIAGTTTLKIEGLRIEETGGDGIYVRTVYGVYGVTLRRVAVSGAYRNGISVIAADGLLVEHSIFMNTRGMISRGRPHHCTTSRSVLMM